MAKLEERAFDSGVAQAKDKGDAELLEWWKQRFGLLAGIPTDAARAGALLPQLRELSRLPDAERRRLTKARMQAFLAIPSDQRQRVATARKLTYAIDPALLKADDDITHQLAPEVPGSADYPAEPR